MLSKSSSSAICSMSSLLSDEAKWFNLDADWCTWMPPIWWFHVMARVVAFFWQTDFNFLTICGVPGFRIAQRVTFTVLEPMTSTWWCWKTAEIPLPGGNCSQKWRTATNPSNPNKMEPIQTIPNQQIAWQWSLSLWSDWWWSFFKSGGAGSGFLQWTHHILLPSTHHFEQSQLWMGFWQPEHLWVDFFDVSPRKRTCRRWDLRWST